MYGKLLKKKQRVSTIGDYVRVFKSCRENPSQFIIINAGNGLLKKWSLANVCHKSPLNKSIKFAIQQFVQLKYDTHGNVLASKAFTPNFVPFKLLLSTNTNRCFELSPMDTKPINKDKERDIRALTKYLCPSKALWFEKHVFTPNLKITY
uniref:Uncharacterized protein n=1 Tax=Cacopsylla melanoneura TaxID=428564 RepID=A0A8D9ELJ0_9HEMI